MKRNRKPRKRLEAELLLFAQLGSRFRRDRTTIMGKDLEARVNTLVSLSIPRGSSPHDAVVEIAEQTNTSLDLTSLPGALKAPILLRGKPFFGSFGKEINQIAENYPDMYWWFSDAGLQMGIIPPAAKPLSLFDDFAGRLTIEKTVKGRISMEAVSQIARALDFKGFTLKGELQPAQLKPISVHNIQHSKKAIRSFKSAVDDLRFVQSIRRRLYVARDRYRDANVLPS